MAKAHRKQLGDYNSIVTFKSLVAGFEDTLGKQAAGVSLKAAGRKAGQQLGESLGLGTKVTDLVEAMGALKQAMGKNGTRLCILEEIQDNAGTLTVTLSDTVDSAAEPPGSARQLGFVLGMVQGALESLTGKKLKAKQTASVLAGQGNDVIELSPA